MCDKAAIGGITHPVCRHTYTIDGVFSAVAYASVAKKLMYVFKYKPYVTDVQKLLWEIMYESLIQQERLMQLLEEKPLLVPIPLSPKKLKTRGYNHAALLSHGLAQHFSLPEADVLIRTRETTSQFALPKEERKINLQGAFSLKNTHDFTGKVVFLVDDIVTTGATLQEAAKVLKKAHVRNVFGVTFAAD